jgi:hypothetical protein
MTTLTSPRIWGRVYASDGSYTWTAVTPSSNGSLDYVYITNLVQVLKLSLGESPFFANWGIPAQRAIIQQIFPDYYVYIVQQQFAQYFASLTISKITDPSPMYRVNIVTNAGTPVNVDIPV